MKTRLNKSKREILKNHAQNTVLPTKEVKTEEKARQLLVDEFKNHHRKSFPESDLKLLGKYNLTKKVTKFRFFVTFKDRNTVCHQFYKGNEVELRIPQRIENDWYDQAICTVPNTSKLKKLYDEHEEACYALNKAKASIQSDMGALIDSARTFEDVVEVWSGAEKVRSEVCANTHQLSICSEDTIKRIKDLTKSA